MSLRKTIALTRPVEQNAALAERLAALGATVISAPAIAVIAPEDAAPLHAACANLAEYDIIAWTSSNAVRFFFKALQTVRGNTTLPAHLRAAAVGPATAAAAREHGVQSLTVAQEPHAAGLLAELSDVAGLRVLLPAANIARDVLADGLRARGAGVDVVTAYQTVPGPGPATLAPLLAANALDAIVFASPSALQYTLAGLGGATALANVAVICIGPTTADAAHNAGLSVAVVAAHPSDDGLVQAIQQVYSDFMQIIN